MVNSSQVGTRSFLSMLAVCWSAGWVVPTAAAQLSPERLYYGVSQRVPIGVARPEGIEGELSIRLHNPATGEVVGESAAVEGRADLAGLLPEIWSSRDGGVRLVQLYAGESAVGAPLVVQPLVSPNTAMLVDEETLQPSTDPRAVPMFEDDRLPGLVQRGRATSSVREVTFSGIRLYEDREIVLQTSAGEIVFRMRPDEAPNTAFNFLHLVEGGFYTGIMFHRVVAALPDGRPFVIQVGDPSGTGSGGPGYLVDLEKSGLPHDFGVLSMARAADPNTGGSQVFVCLSREGTEFLDGRYTAFAEAVSGAEVIRAIAAVEVDENDRPLDPPMVTGAVSRAAPPFTDRFPALSEAGATAEVEVEDPGR